MNKIKSCFSPHVLMHSLFGLGLGILLASTISAAANAWLGVVLIIVSITLDSMRKP